MSKNTITFSSELMKNYKQAEIMSPEAKFQALQTNDGRSLVFSIGTDGVFYVTEEKTAHATGWEKTDLSTARIAADFPAKSGVVCKTFAASQSARAGTIGLAMVVADSQMDHLYLSLGNSASDTSWTGRPNFTGFPFDAANSSVSTVKIVNVFLSEANDGEYIVVDVLRDPASPEGLVFRYYVDPQKTDGRAWHPHDLDIDLEAAAYSSCLGRQANQTIDGLYTSGQVNGSEQFIYQPLYNVWEPDIPASAARLLIPGNAVPDAIAACRNSDLSTDLYAVAQGGLYYFASTNQQDRAEGILLVRNPIFNGARNLFAYSSNDKVVVWGLTNADQVFYTSCAQDLVTVMSAWSYPLPILTGVDLISPYLNRANGGNVFFAVASSDFYKVVQSPGTSIWVKQRITLPPPGTTTPAQKFSSYTTRLQVTDAAKQPVSKVALSLSSRTRAGFYINHLYYVLDKEPVPIETDELGSITIVEWVNGLQANQLTITDSYGNKLQINPMDKPLNKMAQLNTVSNLQNAKITNTDGSTRPLVNPATSSGNLQAVASSVQGLGKAYGSLASPKRLALLSIAQASPHFAAQDIGDTILVEAGDLFSWLASGVKSVIKVIEDDLTGLWHFIATIAGKAYRCVLDCAEKVAEAAVRVFNAIKTAVEDLIKFLEFLFGWQDIARTKAVIKNLMKLYLEDRINDIEVVKQEFDGMIAKAETAINKWAGITDWNGLGANAGAPMTSRSDPTQGLSSPGTLLSHHFQNNATSIRQLNPPPPPTPNQNPIDVLLNALKDEGNEIDHVINQLYDLSKNFDSLNLSEILQQLLGILADAALSTAKIVVDAVLDVLYDVATAALAIFDTPIHIPVISDILSDLGVPELSMLDLFCWIAAVPVTVAYKLATDTAPFPDDDHTRFLINATEFQQVRNAFAPPPQRRTTTMAFAAAAVAAPAPLVSMPASTAKAIFVAGHAASGFFTLMTCFVDPFEAAEESGDNPWAIPSAILNVLGGVTDGVATVLVPKYPIANDAVNWVNRVTLGLRLLNKVVFSGPVQKKLSGPDADGRAKGAIVDAVLVIPALFCSCWHFYELSKDPAGAERSEAIIEETGNITCYISRVGYTTAVNTEGDAKAIAIGVMVAANVCYAGLETAEAMV